MKKIFLIFWVMFLGVHPALADTLNEQDVVAGEENLITAIDDATANIKQDVVAGEEQDNVSECDEDREALQEHLQEYMEECRKKSYPVDDPEKMDYIFSYYNTSIKEYLPKYNQCMKEIILQKIKEVSNEERVQKMSDALNKIEEGYLIFYKEMNNLMETGIIGYVANDSTLGRRLEDILEDVLEYHNRKICFPIDEEEAIGLEHSFEIFFSDYMPSFSSIKKPKDM